MTTPSASTISIRETLDLLDGPFAELAVGVAQGRYAFWLGSGISRDRVDDLERVIKRVLAHLRDRIDTGATSCRFRRALEQALEYAQLSPTERASLDLGRPVDEWIGLDIILQRLTREYARLLDVQVEGEPLDYILWEAVDVCGTFAPSRAQPDCEHLCLAILALEGIVPAIASANWDGLIEAAIFELTKGADGVLRVCVQAEDLRELPMRTRLFKFHGCAVRAGRDPSTYRPLLIARLSQITGWPVNPAYSVIRNELINLAVTTRTLMIGLSAQDTNIQNIFAAAEATMPWTWPCHPPAHVFAEEKLGPDQQSLLKCVYRAAYASSGPAIEAGARIRAFAKPLLVALVLHVLCSKLRELSRAVEAPGLGSEDRAALEAGIVDLRNRISLAAELDRLGFIRAFVRRVSRGLSLFQQGTPPSTSTAYRPVGVMPVHQIAKDPHLATAGLREMTAALGLLGLGETHGDWAIALGNVADSREGMIRISSPFAQTRVFFAANSGAALHLEINDIVSEHDGDALVVHSTAPVPRMSRSPRAAPGRTGKIVARNVNMTALLRDAAGIDELRQRFREEAAL